MSRLAAFILAVGFKRKKVCRFKAMIVRMSVLLEVLAWYESQQGI